MARLHQCLLLVLLAHSDVIAAPRDVTLDDVAKVSNADLKASEPVTLEDATPNDALKQGDRQKRFYDYYGYGFPPMSPVIYPQYPNPNDPYAHSFASDPFLQILRRLQEISGAVNGPNYSVNHPPAPPPPPFPVLFPVILIPQVGCNCKPRPPTPAQNGTNTDDVGISNRFPDMEDERQNWGIVVNQNETEVDDGMPEDFTRPISFVPIRPNRTSTRPPPSVEHGSNQAGPGGAMTTTTTPTPPARPATLPPSPCDAAVLSCCHQPQVTYDCFAALGCPDPTSYGNPCDAQVVLGVIDRYQQFYGQRTG